MLTDGGYGQLLKGLGDGEVAKRMNGARAIWLAIGAVVLIAIVPKEIWISLGVMTGLVLTLFLAIKLFGPQAAATQEPPRRDDEAHDLTLAELIEHEAGARKNRPSFTRAKTPAPGTADTASWSDRRRQVAKENRERAQALREKLPSVVFRPADSYRPGSSDSTIPADNSPTIVAEPRQSERWRLDREAAANANRQRAVHLRSKLAEQRVAVDRAGSAAAGQSTDQAEAFYAAPSPPPQAPSSSRALPPPPAGFAETRWLRADESIEVAGVNVPGGLLYVGPRLKALNGMVEPALINPHLPVSVGSDFRHEHANYWPSYADLSPEGRRAFLDWLSTGRSHPDCSSGLVFLYFYGLERRIIVDSQHDPAAKQEWPIILAEIRRLLAIYGSKSDSFKRYAGDLLSWIELDGGSQRLYERPVPDFPRTYELPPYLRLALGQASVDRKPLPAGLTLSWVRLSPEIYLRTAATRCPDEFGRLFAQRYHDLFGAGLVLPKNRTKLKFSYRPASAGLSGANISMAFGDIPDVTALTAPIKKLAEVVEQCTNDLTAYSRLLGKDPDAAGTLEGHLLLPTIAWPSAAQLKLEMLSDRASEGLVSLSLTELLEILGGARQPVTRDRVRNLARTLESVGIGLEPDVLAGARTPTEQDTVVLFEQPLMEAATGSRAEFQTAALTLQLASAMAHTDGAFDIREITHLQAEIEGWAHLSPAERRRLHAHLQWLTAVPMSLAALKKKLEPLSIQARETLAAFMATLAQSDGFVSPEEVRFLEKVYKALGVEPKRVFSDIHAAGAGRTPISTVQAAKQGFRLDAQRIAALQEDTARVSALLSSIFTEETANATAPATPASEPEVEVELEGRADPLLGLDESHAALLRLLLSRPQWSRAELEDTAADLELMLDGALEQINEAAFDAFDELLIEGDDPISVNIDLVENIEA